MHRISVSIGQDLKFDVFGLIEKFFQINSPVTKGNNRFSGSGSTGVLKFFRRVDNPDSLATPTGRSFNHERVSDLFSHMGHFFWVWFCRAVILSPRLRMTLEGGPINTRPSFSHLSAKSAFSARNP